MHAQDLRSLVIRKENVGEVQFGAGMSFVLDNWDEGAPEAPASPKKSSKVDKNAKKYAELNKHYNNVLDLIQDYQEDSSLNKEVFLASILDVIEEHNKAK